MKSCITEMLMEKKNIEQGTEEQMIGESGQYFFLSTLDSAFYFLALIHLFLVRLFICSSVPY